MIRYESQKVARYYLGLALTLFCLQVAMGLWLAINYAFTLPQSWLMSFLLPRHGLFIPIP